MYLPWSSKIACCICTPQTAVSKYKAGVCLGRVYHYHTFYEHLKGNVDIFTSSLLNVNNWTFRSDSSSLHDGHLKLHCNFCCPKSHCIFIKLVIFVVNDMHCMRLPTVSNDTISCFKYLKCRELLLIEWCSLLPVLLQHLFVCFFLVMFLLLTSILRENQCQFQHNVNFLKWLSLLLVLNSLH